MFEDHDEIVTLEGGKEQSREECHRMGGTMNVLCIYSCIYCTAPKLLFNIFVKHHPVGLIHIVLPQEFYNNSNFQMRHLGRGCW